MFRKYQYIYIFIYIYTILFPKIFQNDTSNNETYNDHFYSLINNTNLLHNIQDKHMTRNIAISKPAFKKKKNLHKMSTIFLPFTLTFSLNMLLNILFFLLWITNNKTCKSGMFSIVSSFS